MEGKIQFYKCIPIGTTIPEPFSVMKVVFPCLDKVLFYTHSDNMNHSDLNSSVNRTVQYSEILQQRRMLQPLFVMCNAVASSLLSSREGYELFLSSVGSRALESLW